MQTMSHHLPNFLNENRIVLFFFSAASFVFLSALYYSLYIKSRLFFLFQKKKDLCQKILICYVKQTKQKVKVGVHTVGFFIAAHFE